MYSGLGVMVLIVLLMPALIRYISPHIMNIVMIVVLAIQFFDWSQVPLSSTDIFYWLWYHFLSAFNWNPFEQNFFFRRRGYKKFF